MPNLIDYLIENRTQRYRFISFVVMPFMTISGIWISVAMLLSKHLR
jgi:hypothetical protein